MLVSSQPVRKAGSTLTLVEIKKLLIFPGRVGSAPLGASLLSSALLLGEL